MMLEPAELSDLTKRYYNMSDDDRDHVIAEMLKHLYAMSIVVESDSFQTFPMTEERTLDVKLQFTVMPHEPQRRAH